MEIIQNLVQSILSWITHSPIVSSVIIFILVIAVFNLIANEFLE